MIVVVAILGVLATATIAVLNPIAQIQKGNDAKRKADLSQIQKALEVYYQDYGAYPAYVISSSHYYLDPLTGSPPVKTQINWGSPWQPYMNIVPKDPVSTKYYVYYTPNGQSYYLYASLDRGTKDLQACTGGVCSGAGLGNMTTICGGICNFGVSSPDKTP